VKATALQRKEGSYLCGRVQTGNGKSGGNGLPHPFKGEEVFFLRRLFLITESQCQPPEIATTSP
jgi:hypothetical protein